MEVQNFINNQQAVIDSLDDQFSDFRNWAEVFDTASIEERKMIICHLIKEIKVYKEYEIDITFNMDYEQFLSAA